MEMIKDGSYVSAKELLNQTTCDKLLAEFKAEGTPARMQRHGRGGKVKMPYVAFAAIFNDWRDQISESKPRVFLLDVSGSHCRPTRIEYYLAKGWRIIDWWLPLDDRSSDDAKRMFNEDRYRILNSWLKSRVSDQGEVFAKDTEISEMKRKMREMEEKLAEAGGQVATATKRTAKRDVGDDGRL